MKRIGVGRIGVAMAALGAAAAPRAAHAQERLTGAWTVSAGVLGESYRFGGGLTQTTGGSGGRSTIASATQWVLPVDLNVPIGDRWSADVATVVTTGQVRFAPAADGQATTATLSGPGDVRLRLTGHLVGDNLLLTMGANVATGVRELTSTQVAALGVLAAPAVGSALPAVSGGPSATTGLVYALTRGGWSWAAGTGVEVRGRYAPVAALTAGLPAPDFDPGTAVHLSLGTHGFVGDAALSLAVTADVYMQDHLATSDRLAPGVAPGAATGAATVRLGPTVGAEVQWHAPTTRFRELTLYASERHRAPFTRDGVAVDGTSASYASAGVRSAYPIGRSTEVTVGADVWRHTGLSVDNTLVTARTTSGAVGLGLARRIGTYTLQPYARVRAGTVDTGVGSASVTGVGAGVTLSARF